MKQSGFAPILIILLVAILGIGGYFVYTNYSNNQIKTTPSAQITQTSVATTPLPIASVNDEKIPLATTTQSGLTPNSTTPSPTSSPTNTKVINYSVPQGWKTVQDASRIFEISYDPNKYTPYLDKSNEEIILNFNGEYKGFAYVFTIKPYTGGSRHQFLKDLYGNIVLQQTYERNYLVNGRSSLVLYNVDNSMSVVAGMVPADSGRAFVVSASFVDEPMTEKIIGTLKLL